MAVISSLPAAIGVLQEQVLEANLEIVKAGLVLFSFGNASGIDRDSGLVVIKPSGVDYAKLKPADMVVCDLDGVLAPGALKPSSDLDTHLHLYREFAGVGGIVHTHSTCATSWAQAGRAIPPFGTTHADYFYGPVPVTESLSAEECAGNYVLNTGHAITRRFVGIDPHAVPAVPGERACAVLLGADCARRGAQRHCAGKRGQMALNTVLLNPSAPPLAQHLLDRHYFRKHGANATYGQR